MSDLINSSFVKNVVGFGWESEFIKVLNVLMCLYYMYYYKMCEMVEKEFVNYEKGEMRVEVVK